MIPVINISTTRIHNPNNRPTFTGSDCLLTLTTFKPELLFCLGIAA